MTERMVLMILILVIIYRDGANRDNNDSSVGARDGSGVFTEYSL